jgi:predicted dehydrogenase
MKEVRIGLIGTGYIGKAHAIAYAQAPTVFNLRGRLVREMVAEVTPELAAARAQAFGFNRSTGDWRALVADPAIDVVDICPTICIKRWRWRRSATASTSTRRSRWR